MVHKRVRAFVRGNTVKIIGNVSKVFLNDIDITPQPNPSGRPVPVSTNNNSRQQNPIKKIIPPNTVERIITDQKHKQAGE